jgi:hypothetical protein
MTGGANLMMLAVVVIAFIAGYSIVSYVVRKLKVGKPAQDDQSHKESNPTTEDTRDLK